MFLLAESQWECLETLNTYSMSSHICHHVAKRLLIDIAVLEEAYYNWKYLKTVI